MQVKGDQKGLGARFCSIVLQTQLLTKSRRAVPVSCRVKSNTERQNKNQTPLPPCKPKAPPFSLGSKRPYCLHPNVPVRAIPGASNREMKMRLMLRLPEEYYE